MAEHIGRRQLLAGMGALAAAASAPVMARAQGWDLAADVVVLGAGAAGCCAAIEAAQSGASVLLLEHLAQAGGASGLGPGVIYAGGGTALQRALGVADDTDAMFAFLSRAGGPNPPLDKLRLYCEESPAHFDWLVAQGVTYREALSEARGTPADSASLFFSGAERDWPARDFAAPAPRGHVPGLSGTTGGAALMRALLRRVAELGVDLRTSMRGERLVMLSDGRVGGVAVSAASGLLHVQARRGVVLSCGGFIQERAMVRRYAPRLHECATPWGGAGDLGMGINMAVAAGAAAPRMDEGAAMSRLDASGAALAGLLVNAAGQRFIAEDSWEGLIGHAITYEQRGRAWLVTDQAGALPETQQDFELAARSNTIGGIEEALGLPRGALQQSVAYYNRYAGRGEDPQFRKSRAFLRPVQGPPYSAWAVSGERAFFPAFTLGGVATGLSGEVLDAYGEAMPGLYAAGRNASGMVSAPLLASGLSLGDATFFGRRAGRAAAGAA
ncbi:FAD-dependent oxidoreductase [Mangrovimicrobium sediminis]|uniref:FAD-dependent oxidoreductase n=1 Tax=Mangrovimicrobium sediminis TaxID=2562682 RepID=A0A4Z0LY40_9GAMM|nr:FAD-dependent oxidoreductase [Haliea sp. SAOS-164]TGD72067.1 FAD-dependent oxidoreductase [Haliea sp. SAOS-164]